MTPIHPSSEGTTLTRDGVRLAHVEVGPRDAARPPIVFIHGWKGNHGIFTPQIAHFSRTHRVAAVDLRGHGLSDAPQQDYTVLGFAEDIAWQCEQLGLDRPVVIGQSFGGAVARELCGRFPRLASGLMMIDSIVMPHPSVREHPDVVALLDGIGGPDHLEISRANGWEIVCEFDDLSRRRWIFESYILDPTLRTPQHVASSALRHCIAVHDPEPAARACTTPMAYISADVPLVNLARDLDRLRALCPQLVEAKTLLAGHFNTIEVADQVNAMIERFLAVGLRRGRR